MAAEAGVHPTDGVVVVVVPGVDELVIVRQLHVVVVTLQTLLLLLLLLSMLLMLRQRIVESIDGCGGLAASEAAISGSRRGHVVPVAVVAIASILLFKIFLALLLMLLLLLQLSLGPRTVRILIQRADRTEVSLRRLRQHQAAHGGRGLDRRDRVDGMVVDIKVQVEHGHLFCVHVESILAPAGPVKG